MISKFQPATIVTAFLLWSVWLPVAALDAPENWIVDESTGCKVSNPSPQPNETMTWSGQCKGGFAEGTGKLQWYENKKPYQSYDGEMQAGDFNGHGIWADLDGKRYEGEFRDGEFNGHGVLVFEGGRYDGEWREGKADGAGVLVAPDKKEYRGAWTNGCFNQGQLRAAVGADSSSCP